MPFFSVIIPSRDRPHMVAAAINSVLQQDFSDYEILVVNDGSEAAFEMADIQVPANALEKVRICNLDSQPRGRGPGYSRNVGVWASKGRYCAFLDDDDVWVKDDHLTVAYQSISASEHSVDLYFAQQEAFISKTAEVKTKSLWMYPLARSLRERGEVMNMGCYQVDVSDLVDSGGFSHLNTTIVSRALFDLVKGIDEYLGYEEDLDFYLRAIDMADNILFCPDIVARHNVPDIEKNKNASTAISELQRLNLRLCLLNKNMMNANHEVIVDYCRMYSGSTTKRMVEKYVEVRNYRFANQFAWRALVIDFSTKWFLYCLFLLGSACFSRGVK